jgi:hypothetical protein
VSLSKIKNPNKNLGRQRCAEKFNSCVKGLRYFFNVWLTMQLEIYSYNEPTRCTIYLHFISLPRLYMFGVHFSPSSGGQIYNVAMVLDLLVRRLSAGLDKKELPELL